jgi:D-arabinose 1-dehydrogenase-like Zn-dependent alcohol dehydrogenase
MKAIVYEKYGSPDVLELREVEKPAPKDNEVLIKVHAASINSWDWDMLTGRPLEYRLWSGLLKPTKTKILGCDVVGRIESVGRNVKQLHPGDDVFGDLCEGFWGGFAEYVCARENELTLKPAGMTFEEAAATPQAGLLALQGLCDKREIKPGQRILIKHTVHLWHVNVGDDDTWRMCFEELQSCSAVEGAIKWDFGLFFGKNIGEKLACQRFIFYKQHRNSGHGIGYEFHFTPLS